MSFQHILGFTSDAVAADAILGVRSFGANPFHPSYPQSRTYRAFLALQPVGEAMAWFLPNDPTRRNPNAGMLLYRWEADVAIDADAAFIPLSEAVGESGTSDPFLRALAQDASGETSFLAVSSATGRRVFIAGSEIFRFYFGTSSRLARTILNGGILSPKCELYQSATPATAATKGVAHLVVPRSVLPSDVPTIARWVLTPGRIGLESASDTYRHSLAGRPIFGMRPLRARPPFTGLTRLAGWALFDHDDQRNAVFVFGLDRCSAPYPFEQLHWRFDRDLRESQDGETRSPSHTGRKPGGARVHVAPERLKLLYLDDNATPTSRYSVEAVQVDDLARRFPGLALHGVQRTVRSVGPVADQASVGSFVLRQPLGHSARAASTQGDRGIQGVELTVGDASSEHREHGKPIGPSPERILRRTIAIAEGMSSVCGTALRSRVVTPLSAEALGFTFNVFPTTIEGKRWRWLYLDDARTQSRPLLIVEFERGGHWGYLIDVVRRAFEPMALLLCRTPSGERAADDCLGELVSLMARLRVRGHAIGPTHGAALGLAISLRMHRLSMQVDPSAREYAKVIFPPKGLAQE